MTNDQSALSTQHSALSTQHFKSAKSAQSAAKPIPPSPSPNPTLDPAPTRLPNPNLHPNPTRLPTRHMSSNTQKNVALPQVRHPQSATRFYLKSSSTSELTSMSHPNVARGGTSRET